MRSDAHRPRLQSAGSYATQARRLNFDLEPSPVEVASILGGGGDSRTALRTKALYALFLRRSAHRFFISSDNRFLPAGVSPPRFFGAGAFEAAAFDFPARRAAQRRFIASDMRRRHSEVSLPCFRRAGARETRDRPDAAPSSAAIARSSLSLSVLRLESMPLMSTDPASFFLDNHQSYSHFSGRKTLEDRKRNSG